MLVPFDLAAQENQGKSVLVDKISDISLAIDEAAQPREISLFPGWMLHSLKGDLKGFWSVTVSGNWRVIFRFEKGDAFDVDFHRLSLREVFET